VRKRQYPSVATPVTSVGFWDTIPTTALVSLTPSQQSTCQSFHTRIETPMFSLHLLHNLHTSPTKSMDKWRASFSTKKLTIPTKQEVTSSHFQKFGINLTSVQILKRRHSKSSCRKPDDFQKSEQPVNLVTKGITKKASNPSPPLCLPTNPDTHLM
jgi:hypothetical protein